MTLVCVPRSVAGPGDLAAALDNAAAARDAGAALVEWRAERLAERGGEGASVLRRLVGDGPLPCIVTLRSPEEGGASDASEEERAALLRALVGGTALPRYVDVELATFAAGGPMRDAALALCAKHDGGEPQAGGPADAPRLILSTHDFEQRPADLFQRVAAMAAEPACDVIKVAFQARSLRDALGALELLRERPRPMIALAMGPFGEASRVLAPKFGGLLTFASMSEEAATAPGQPTLEQLAEVYRFTRIGRATRVYGIVGWPVAHSLSPLLHNAGFAAAELDRCYVPLPVAPGWEPFKATMHALLDAPGLDVGGASVTIPHKSHLVRFVREMAGSVEPQAAAIDAANTLVVDDHGGLACRNTDVPAIAGALGGAEALAGRRVLVIGAGGAARAATAACAEAGATVTVTGRTAARVAGLVKDLAGTALAGETSWSVASAAADALAGERFDVVVNATPVGMEGGPAPDASPLPDGVVLDADVVVFDTVYAPRETPLVRAAMAAGARVVTGDAMFVRQAALQFEAWTGRGLPPACVSMLLGAG